MKLKMVKLFRRIKKKYCHRYNGEGAEETGVNFMEEDKEIACERKRKLQKQEVLISVLMCVYNTRTEYLKAAIESILVQSFSRFEFIIVDDGSEAYVEGVVALYADSRIKLLKNSKNIGLTKSLNLALRNAKGKYIARMDADDISLRERLQIQYDYMEQHPETAVCGSLAYQTGSKECIGFRSGWSQELLKVKLLIDNAGPVHPTALIRRSILTENNISYNELMPKAQDYALWNECIQYGKIEWIHQILLVYRTHEGQVSVSGREKQLRCNEKIRLLQLKALCVELNEMELQMFLHLKDYAVEGTLETYFMFLNKLLEANKVLQLYHPSILEKELFMHWFLTGVKFKEKRNSVFRYWWTYQRLLNPAFTVYILSEKLIKKRFHKIFSFLAVKKNKKELKKLCTE